MMRHRSSRQVNRGRLRNKWKRKIRKISEINAKLESMKKETDVANILVRDMKKKSEEIKRQALGGTQGSSQPAGGMANPQARPREHSQASVSLQV